MLYLPIFTKKISLNYLQNSRMILNILCNDDKICEKILPELFQYKCIPNYYCFMQYFLAKKPVGNLGNLSSFSASHQLFLVLLNGHLVFCEEGKQTRSTMG